MLKQVTSLIIPKFIARKPKIKHGTYNKYGFVITLHQYCIVIIGGVGAVGVQTVIVEKKVAKVYQENCWDVISVGIVVISLVMAVYFGDWIKVLVKLNLVALLLLVQAVYVGIRAYVKGCKRARGYY